MIEAYGSLNLGIVIMSCHALKKRRTFKMVRPRTINERTKHKPNSQLHDMTPGLFLTVTASMHEHEPFH